MGGTGSRRPSHVLNPVPSFRAGTSHARWWHVNFAGFCRRWLEYGETGRQLDSCLRPSATGVHRCPGVEGDEEREPPAQRRPIPTAQVDASRARQFSDSCRYQVWRNRIEAGPLSRCIKITLEDPPCPPARGTIDRWQLAARARTELRLQPVSAAKGASTTDDERLLCCTLSRFCMLGCSTRKLLETDRAPASSAWLPAGESETIGEASRRGVSAVACAHQHLEEMMVERDLFRLALPNPRTLTLSSRCPRWAVDSRPIWWGASL